MMPENALAGAMGARRGNSGDWAPDGWRKAFEFVGREPPEPPAWWPCWYASASARVRLADAENVAVEVRKPSGWYALAFGRSFDAAVRSARRLGLVPAGAVAPRDGRRWPYEGVATPLDVRPAKEACR